VGLASMPSIPSKSLSFETSGKNSYAKNRCARLAGQTNDMLMSQVFKALAFKNM